MERFAQHVLGWLLFPVVAIGGIIWVLLVRSPLFTKGPGARWLTARETGRESRRMQDPLYALLRREVARLGAEYERLPYERLLKLDEDESLWEQSTVVDGLRLGFSVELANITKAGEVYVCIDAHPPDDSRGYWKSWPSYCFRKNKDGQVSWD